MQIKPLTVVLLSFLTVLGAALWYIDYANRTHPAPWPMLAGDSGRRNYADQPLPSEPELLWSHELEAGANLWIVAGVDGSIYVTTASGLVVVGPDGERRWAWMGNEQIHSVALGRQGAVYVHARDGVRAFDAQGQLLWIRALAQRNGGSMLVGQGGMIYTVAFPYLYAISDDGNIRWRYQLSGLNTLPAETKEGHIVMVLGESLVAVNRQGKEAWRLSIGETAVDTMLVVGLDGSIYVRGKEGLLIRNPKERLIEARYDEGRYLAYLAAGKQVVQDGLVRRDQDGKLLWSVGSSDPNAIFSLLVDSRGRTLLIRQSSSNLRPDRVPLEGTTGTVIRRQATILDPHGQIEWEADLATPLGPAITTGDGRFCYVGRAPVGAGRALLCFGNK